MSEKKRVASIWLDGCSGCHMSILDIDERILLVAQKADWVWGPYVDAKEFPDNVDVTLVEGAISSESDLHHIKEVREKTKVLVSLGDCAVTGNVSAMRNPFGARKVLDAVYSPVPIQIIPKLLPMVRPVHEVVQVDLHVPGCPPHADLIFHVLAELLEGRMPELKAKFG